MILSLAFRLTTKQTHSPFRSATLSEYDGSFQGLSRGKMRRRDFVTLLGGVVAWPLGASAQQAKAPTRIGLLPFGSPSNAYDQSLVDAFRSGLRQAGLIEGRDMVLDIVCTSGSDADTDKAVAELL